MARFNGWRLTRAGIVFIIVVIVLAVLVFAGLRFAQQRGDQVRSDEAAKIALESQNEQTPAIAEDTPTPAPNDQQSSNDAEQAAPAAPATPSSDAPAALPETGITSIFPILFLAAATYGGTRFVRQRRSQFQG